MLVIFSIKISIGGRKRYEEFKVPKLTTSERSTKKLDKCYLWLILDEAS